MSQGLQHPEEQLMKSSTMAGGGRMPKHMESVELISRIQQTQNRLQELIDEICGQPVDVNEKSAGNHRDTVPLVEFLNATPEALSNINTRLEDQIGHLRDILL